MSVVVFDPAAFKARYPEFAAVSDMLLTQYFNEATLYLCNACGSIVTNITIRAVLLNMLTAHIAYLGGVLSADGLPRPVGRLSQAAEGSVSASFDWLQSSSAQWYQQTQYGAAFWQATLPYRTFRYVPHHMVIR